MKFVKGFEVNQPESVRQHRPGQTTSDSTNVRAKS